MPMLREKLAIVSGVMRQAVGWFKSGGIVSPMLLIYVLHMLWPDFRPFSIVFVVSIGFLWDRPVTEQRPSIAASPLGDICARVWALRTTRPLGMVLGTVAAVPAGLYLVWYVLPLWLSLTMAALLVFWDRYQFGVADSFSACPSLRDTSTEQQEIDEFVPELTEVSRVLLQEVGEQGADTVPALLDEPGAGGAAVAPAQSAEEDEEQYLSTLVPVAIGHELESAELSGSSSDELFCPEPGPAARPKAKHTDSKPTIEFKSSHFNANSSSDSDDNMSRGLCFNDDDSDGGVSRRQKQQQQQPQQQTPDLATMMMMSASSLASNVLVDTVYKRLLDAGTLHQQQQQPASILHPTVRRRPEPDVPEEEDGESTDADEDSDFEMLNSEELNNL